MEIIDYPNYLIYNDGRVYSKCRKIFLKQDTINTGYLAVNLWKNNKFKKFTIHRLVGLHYLERVEGKNEIDHIDRNKTNNHINNLRWCNHSENNINTGVFKNNKLGIKNIYFRKDRNIYIFDIVRKGKRHVKNFKTLEEAIEYRDEYLRVLGRQ